MVIELLNVHKEFGNRIVLNNINLKFESSHVYGLWGENGSGKTMLMRALSGLIIPTKGSIRYDDKELGKDISFPESIGVLLESPAFLDSYTGFQNLEIIAKIRGIADQQQIQKAMISVGLLPEDSRKFRKYSLGMKQRLGIAAAIMEDPDVVLLDEPTNSLDTMAVEFLRPIISELKNKGGIVILSSHDRHFLFDVSDIVYEMKAGEIKGMLYE